MACAHAKMTVNCTALIRYNDLLMTAICNPSAFRFGGALANLFLKKSLLIACQEKEQTKHPMRQPCVCVEVLSQKWWHHDDVAWHR